VRRIDHVKCYADDVAAQEQFFTDELGFKVTERIVTDERDDMLATWIHVTNLSHDIAFLKDPIQSRGRLHHIAYFYGSALTAAPQRRRRAHPR
jgi:catechol 2,3-dioxygenase-like lactoylglutathione lyase family enzyme